MSSIPLAPNVIQPLMQIVTMQALGIDPADPSAPEIVRVGWQTQGQPAQTIDQDVIYIRCVEEDDEYNRIRDQEITDAPPISVLITTIYTRVWRTFWTFYGPNSFDNARIVKSFLLSQEGHDSLLGANNTYGQLPVGSGGYGGGQINIYLVTDIPAPRRVPENRNGQWWERIDFDCQFNEQVNETEVVNTVASSEIITENENGVVSDIVVQGS